MATLGKKAFPTVVAVLVLAVTSRADMRVTVWPDPSPGAAAVAATSHAEEDFPSPLVGPRIADSMSLAIPSLPVATGEADHSHDMLQPQRVLTDGHNSFGLCLYALLGLGLFKSPPLLKKFAFGVVPQWYHDGGPFQIGHSVAISPDCLIPVSAYCFVRPEYTDASPIPLYRARTVAHLWRKSPFTPTVEAPRGPPNMS